MQLILVFVHGYSVTNLETYGGLPLRLRDEARALGYDVRLEQVHLGRYISFNDEVRLNDISLAFEHAVRDQVRPADQRFVCITHSTGGPVVRNWWHNHYRGRNVICPMSHLIMLAPANHGSALAQLGKTKLSRLKSWFGGVEPGQRVLDWLELGGNDAWNLNKTWIENETDPGFYQFVITGQSIDRKLYDHINSYTGEPGSDGVVRVASANLNSRYVLIEQPEPTLRDGLALQPQLQLTAHREAQLTPLLVLADKSHSNDTIGIMKSVSPAMGGSGTDTIRAILDCIAVNDQPAYRQLYDSFKKQTDAVQEASRVEVDQLLLRKKLYIHDRYSMLIFRVHDSAGLLLNDFDLLVTAGDNDPDDLPVGFFADRQCNLTNRSVLTYYLNYDVLAGTGAVVGPNGETMRQEIPPTGQLGLILRPRPAEGFIHYMPCLLPVSEDFFQKALQPNATTLIDITLRRVVNSELFRFIPAGNQLPNHDFKKAPLGKDIASEPGAPVA